MIGLDTNVLVRALTSDDPAQSPIARETIAGLTKQTPGYLNVVVLVELAWTLRRRYGYSNHEIAAVVERMSCSPSFVIADRDAVGLALARVEIDGLDFPDALVAELNLLAGCRNTLTFDSRAGRSSGFQGL